MVNITNKRKRLFINRKISDGWARTRYKSLTKEEKIQLAKEELNKGDLNFRRICYRIDLPETTVRRAIEAMTAGKKIGVLGRPRLCNEAITAFVRATIQENLDNGTPLLTISPSFFQLWWKEQGDLTIRTAKKYEEARKKSEASVNCDLWIEETKKWAIEQRIMPEDIWNYDESAVRYDQVRRKFVWIKKKNTQQHLKAPCLKKHNQSFHITVICCISFTGAKLPPYFIIQLPKARQSEYVFTDAPGPQVGP